MTRTIHPHDLRPSDLFRAFQNGPVYVVAERTDTTLTVQPLRRDGTLRPARTVALADLRDRPLYPL